MILSLITSLSFVNPVIHSIAIEEELSLNIISIDLDSLFLNIHTHTPTRENERIVPSFGLHPWHLSQSWKEELMSVEGELQKSMNLVSEVFSSVFSPFFIGECGLDRLCSTPYNRQLEAFEEQIHISERLGLPIILHCVRALDDVLRLKQGTHQPWIFHGFRGKPQQLQQLLNHGFFVSFGFHHNVDSLCACPLDHFFLETDDNPQPIVSLYSIVANQLGTTPEELNSQFHQNLIALFQGK